jgi:glutamine amidotransferase
MTSGVVNADGLGIGWYHPETQVNPFTYKNTLPIWNDINLPELSRYIQSGCVLGYVRSATAGQALDLSNCQPFRESRLLFIHNGCISNFRNKLYRPIRDRLSDEVYQSINGTTDSEHIFALLVNELQAFRYSNRKGTIRYINHSERVSSRPSSQLFCNLIISDGHRLVASRYAYGTSAPTLYWLRDDPSYPDAVIIASEPLFTGQLEQLPEQ